MTDTTLSPQPAEEVPAADQVSETGSTVSDTTAPASFVSSAGEDTAKSEGVEPDPAGDQVVSGDDARSSTEEAADTASSEDYGDFSVPEGVELDPDVLTEFKSVAKQQGLPQEAAQAYVDLGVKMLTKWVSALEAQAQAAREANRKAVEADPLFAGPQGPENVAAVARARRLVADVEGLSELLDTHGLGDHPAVVKAFHRFGQALSEDKVLGSTAGGSPPASRPLAEKLYVS